MNSGERGKNSRPQTRTNRQEEAKEKSLERLRSVLSDRFHHLLLFKLFVFLFSSIYLFFVMFYFFYGPTYVIFLKGKFKGLD